MAASEGEQLGLDKSSPGKGAVGKRRGKRAAGTGGAKAALSAKLRERVEPSAQEGGEGRAPLPLAPALDGELV